MLRLPRSIRLVGAHFLHKEAMIKPLPYFYHTRSCAKFAGGIPSQIAPFGKDMLASSVYRLIMLWHNRIDAQIQLQHIVMRNSGTVISFYDASRRWCGSFTPTLQFDKPSLTWVFANLFSSRKLLFHVWNAKWRQCHPIIFCILGRIVLEIHDKPSSSPIYGYFHAEMV